MEGEKPLDRLSPKENARRGALLAAADTARMPDAAIFGTSMAAAVAIENLKKSMDGIASEALRNMQESMRLPSLAIQEQMRLQIRAFYEPPIELLPSVPARIDSHSQLQTALSESREALSESRRKTAQLESQLARERAEKERLDVKCAALSRQLLAFHLSDPNTRPWSDDDSLGYYPDSQFPQDTP